MADPWRQTFEALDAEAEQEQQAAPQHAHDHGTRLPAACILLLPSCEQENLCSLLNCCSSSLL